ncbi:hypothetical protein GZ77_00090 [Endozoicomonas montiporae]|uniref:Cytokinin riboside 5'-monophosphate phosphoribohydrolase n=2 Tax=Endozoicomonas montiporae TaxID=1027273 RepID=A0A081N9M0_9GAMM|nr:TIGR00730 family Rossman fold protein [Endozoicomonas montiporae]AMO54995.1 hypothetical protein EZMO1_0769 [Endozoicomonas montiporae CL-33]KEQ15143.1 hypothetical protein GZ77_00090 [Endozoicomonas montiporae]
MTSISVFCGANTGHRPEYKAAALDLVEAMVKRDITLVYGGGNIGLMGHIANHALSLSGRVVGVIPQMMVDLEKAHESLTEMHIVDTMHERKQMLCDLSDGCIALPGGTGTLDELFEYIVLLQVGAHDKPSGLLNVSGYFDHLLKFMDHANAEGYVTQSLPDILSVDEKPEPLLDTLITRMG